MTRQTEDTMYEIYEEVEKKDFVRNLINSLKKWKPKRNMNIRTYPKGGNTLYSGLKNNGTNFRKARSTY